VPAPKERDPKHTVKKLISLTLFEFNAFVSIRSGLVRNPGYMPNIAEVFTWLIGFISPRKPPTQAVRMK
jgi:hypothetical protein